MIDPASLAAGALAGEAARRVADKALNKAGDVLPLDDNPAAHMSHFERHMLQFAEELISHLRHAADLSKPAPITTVETLKPTRAQSGYRVAKGGRHGLSVASPIAITVNVNTPHGLVLPMAVAAGEWVPLDPPDDSTLTLGGNASQNQLVLLRYTDKREDEG